MWPAPADKCNPFVDNNSGYVVIMENPCGHKCVQRHMVQDNADLFLRTRNNITAILNSMSGMPGIMSQMPPLPVTINEDLVTTILPNTSQAFMFNSPAGITVKQEPRC
ncbi:hypothetical protein IEQ34_014356 [Dendrobium chrysotoxum]|uniref:Uncharacterized protein n=1 Tax=Dendrobium chrysotoxum TaxID=161865 RepID=A0AAV7G3N4_DENCH|nr:hypothetical protein IEQ34_014356 [Dendrobium chrysotoxum]